MESAAIQATPSGCLFADWIARKGVSKSTAYSWRSALRIEPQRRRVAGRVEVWLSAEQEALLDRYAEALEQHTTAAEALAAVGLPPVPLESDGPAGLIPVESTGAAGLIPLESDGPAPAVPLESAGVQQLEQLRARLAALRDAVELGAPLSTAEASLLMGARPGGAVVVRGRLRAVREARNCWTIEPD
jgi:hypothetical protein